MLTFLWFFGVFCVGFFGFFFWNLCDGIRACKDLYHVLRGNLRWTTEQLSGNSNYDFGINPGWFRACFGDGFGLVSGICFYLLSESGSTCLDDRI